MFLTYVNNELHNQDNSSLGWPSKQKVGCAQCSACGKAGDMSVPQTIRFPSGGQGSHWLSHGFPARHSVCWPCAGPGDPWGNFRPSLTKQCLIYGSKLGTGVSGCMAFYSPHTSSSRGDCLAPWGYTLPRGEWLVFPGCHSAKAGPWFILSSW